MSTASIIIIGDEILSNKFQDENTPYLLEQCAKRHIKVLSVCIIPDDLQRIAQTLQDELQRSQYIFTTGGVGPTHDDKTFEGIALGLNRPLFRHPVLAAKLEKYLTKITEDTYRMATVPEGTILLPTTRNYPQVMVPTENGNEIYIFPGVPKLLKEKFEAIADRLQGKIIFRKKLGFEIFESDIATELRQIQEDYPLVSIGSYPRFHEHPSLILTVESSNEALCEDCSLKLKQAFQTFFVGMM